ncbi:hypothetical protein [Parapedobacter pyrenivorans]|uniref:hypothetical protein n=1 Tax=Parapedobacter pyrenivorans TaxID=1305674 RepID=UPI003342C570
MSLNQQPELKKAILDLPQREKDKLLVRLINKDRLLMKQLHFQLLENETDLDERSEAVHRQLVLLFDRAGEHVPNTNQYRHSDQLMGELKYGSGLVNEHFAVTKDKMSEVRLRLFLVSRSFARFDKLFEANLYGRNERLLSYQAARIKYILGKFEKLHEDLQFEFREELNEALAFAHRSGMKPYMEALGLPKEA